MFPVKSCPKSDLFTGENKPEPADVTWNKAEGCYWKMLKL